MSREVQNWSESLTTGTRPRCLPSMDNAPPLVSIGLPVYNGENFVAEAIRCVLAQTFTDWELIISDNASTDASVSICREFAARDSRIRIYQNPRNLGVCPNYNRALQSARGRYFKWIAHDDLFGPEFLECCVRELESDPRAGLVFPRLVYVDASGQPLRHQTSDLSISGATAESRVRQLMRLEGQSTDIFWSQFGLIRLEVLLDTRLMGLYSGGDQILLLEIALRGSFKQVKKELFFRREHEGASTLRRSWTARERARFACADDRRRIVFPYFRLLKEHLIAIRNSSLSWQAKMQCAAVVLRRFCGQWKYFIHEVLEARRDIWRAK